ncbi:hypothetical protein SAMD00019534_057090, partial [Acytostelium subglobosum LB1]|uniref:hypothetical protein n=1 Tax=Acytostelium subglobosum LB1 TaxID=1410327 RepID=UPI000644A320
MSGTYCINGTSMPDTMNDFKSIMVPMNTGGVVIGVILIVGSILSTVPQHYNIIKSRSTTGLSYLWMYLGNIKQFTGAINIFMLKYPQVDACRVLGFMECAPSILSIFQVFSFFAFTFPLYILYIIFTPLDLKKIVKEKGDKEEDEYRRGKIFFGILLVFILIISVLTSIFMFLLGPCHQRAYIFAYSIGMVSTVITFIQWLPQIYKTFRDKTVGTFSIMMLIIQFPGNVLMTYFLIFVSHESVSTWLSYVSTTLQVAILLVLLLYYHFKNKNLSDNIAMENTKISKVDISVYQSTTL